MTGLAFDTGAAIRSNMSDTEEWITVAVRSQIAVGAVIGVEAHGTEIAVYNLAGEFFATSNICTHALAFLSDGWLDGEEIECPLHAGRFEVKTGKGLGDPIPCDIETYPVRVIGEDIQVLVKRKA
jgi:naphthalene 1,2-dioxygenase ferredoxin component